MATGESAGAGFALTSQGRWRPGFFRGARL